MTGDAQYNGSVSYGLDPVGNRLSQTASLYGIASMGLSYNVDDQILRETYDANGNTTATGGKTFAYDSEKTRDPIPVMTRSMIEESPFTKLWWSAPWFPAKEEQ